MLTAWSIWKHRNACVFDGVSPSVAELLHEVREVGKLWCLADTRKLQALAIDRVGTLFEAVSVRSCTVTGDIIRVFSKLAHEWGFVYWPFSSL